MRVPPAGSPPFSRSGGHGEPDSSASLDHARVTALLVEAGLTREDADTVAYGITGDRPGDPEGPVLRTLQRYDVDLRALSDALVARHEPRLAINVARDRLREWLGRHGPRVVAVLTIRGVDAAEARAEVETVLAPGELEYVLDPRPEEYLAPVVTVLWRRDLVTDPAALAADAPSTLADLVGRDVRALDDQVRVLYDDEAGAARLRELARGWARELRLVSLLVRANGAPATVVRTEAAQTDDLLGRPDKPSELVPLLEQLVPGVHLIGLRRELGELLVDELPGSPPDRGGVLDLAESHGVPVSVAPTILRTLNRDRSRRVATYTRQVRALLESDVQPRPPAHLSAPPPRQRSTGHKHVSPGEVSVDVERRKKKAGDEAESWVVTAMAQRLIGLGSSARDRAIQDMVALLDDHGFVGTATDRVHEHAAAAREPDLDDEQLIDRLTEFVHLAEYSDGFGFDVLGWVPDESSSGGGYPIALEVKSASGSFFFSSGEWACAERMRDAYAVLAVRRRPGSEAPVAMDLLADPVTLCESGQMTSEADTYKIRYATSE